MHPPAMQGTTSSGINQKVLSPQANLASQNDVNLVDQEYLPTTPIILASLS